MKIIQKYLIALVLVIALPALVNAANIGNVVKEGDILSNRGNGGHLDVGPELGYVSGSIYGYPESNTDSDWHGSGFAGLTLSGRYQWHGIFLEAYSGSIVGGGIGYNFYDGDNWAFDLLTTEMHGYLGRDDSDTWDDLKERESDLGLGLRVSYFSSKVIAQGYLLSDVSGVHDGSLASLYIGKNWQARNWNFHALIGASYRNRKAADYYFGIDDDESGELFPEYQASAGFQGSGDVGVTYPISEKWVFNSSYQIHRFSDNLYNSPLVTNRYFHRISCSISYAF